LDIWLTSPEDDDPPLPLLNTSFNEGGAAFSPNGRWLAYVSDESGREEVYVRDLSGSGGKLQISNGGGNEPCWSRTGREIFYRNQGWMMSAGIISEEPLRASKPKPIFEADYDDAGALYPNYDIAPDGSRFVMVRSEQERVATQVNVVLNWFAELERRVPVSEN
jgi:serine/threonine-protein kinase